MIRPLKENAPKAPSEAGANEALDAFARVDVFRDRDLVACPALELPSEPRVRALGVLAKYDEIHVGRAAIAQGYEPIGECANGPDVGVEIKAKTKTEENLARMLEPRNARVAERAEKNRARLSSNAVARISGESASVAKVALGA